MAVKKTQMYRRNLDGTETNLNPLTESQYVLMENGQTVQEVLSDRDSDKYTPVITNSSSTFKVGQGDNVDLSSSMKEGAYDSCVLKGKTMVNCIQEPSSQDVVLPYEFTDGQYVTINDTKESGALGVELKGQTLVNLQQKGSYWNINGTENNPNSNASYRSDEGFPLSKLKPNTKYLVKFSRDISAKYGSFFFVQGTQTTWAMQSGGWGIVTTKSELTSSTTSIHVYPRENNGVTAESLQDVHPMIIEYQEGMENWDIPYFEGMTNCKMPILHTVGKNLFDGKLQSGYLQDATGTPTGNKGLHGTTYIPCKPNTAYVISGTLNGVVPRFYFYDREKNYLGYEVGESPYRLFTSRSNSSFMRIRLFSNEVLDISQYGQIQIEESTQETSYEPHKSSILSLPEEVVLGGLGSARDTLNTVTGKYTKRTDTMTVMNYKNSLGSGLIEGAWSIVVTPPNKKWQSTMLCVSDKFSMGGGHSDRNCGFYENPANFVFFDRTVNSADEFIAKYGDFSFTYILENPIITKINLPSTLKSWNTTTHIYSEITENSLYPILSHSNPTYPVILKPSTKYSIVANSYSNSHANSAINFNLGGATASTTVGNRVTTITTPSTLTSEELVMSGRGNKLNNVMVIEGDVVGDEPYFEGICDCKSPILSNIGKNLVDSSKIRKWMDKDTHFEYPDYIRVEPNTWYITNLEMGCWDYYNINKEHIGQKYTNLAYPNIPSYLTPNDCYYLKMRCWGGNTDTSKGLEYYQKYFALYEGMSNQPHEPHKSNTTTFEQKDGKTIVLRSLPNGVCDTLNVETGEYVQRIGEVVFDGSNDEGWFIHSENGFVNLRFRTTILSGKMVKHHYTTVDMNSDKMACYPNSEWSIDREGMERDSVYLSIRKNIETLDGFKQWLSQSPITVQYPLATPIVSTIDVQGFPYAYTNGHVQLSSGHSGQSLTPKVEYSLSANKTGQINSNTKRVSAHQKQLDDFEAMMLTSMVQSAYDKAILQFDYEMQMMSLGGE